MLSLVDYAGSDDEESSGSQDQESKSVYGEVLNPAKHSTPGDKDKERRDGFSTYGNNDVIGEYNNGITEEMSPILTNLPPSIRLDNKLVEQEKELDDLVKQKDWELELAKKVERKRKHRHARHSSSRNYHSCSRDGRTAEKKAIVIEAFGGLKGLLDDEKQGNSVEHLGHSIVASSSADLLSLLPQPKNVAKGSRSINISLFNHNHSAKNDGASKILTPNPVANEIKSAEECDTVSDEDFDPTDFFGLKTSNNPDPISNIAFISDHSGISRDNKFNQVELTEDAKIENDISHSIPYSEINTEGSDISAPDVLPGAIDNSQALYMIYSRDVAHLGGTVSNAAEVLDNMVDVNVDKVLGPNVHATLLKNLHNKSLAEATLSHLANIPKSKDSVGMVARRKHQITYLASVAVAREEQLAEQWSVNRHNKRTSARKYGF